LFDAPALIDWCFKRCVCVLFLTTNIVMSLRFVIMPNRVSGSDISLVCVMHGLFLHRGTWYHSGGYHAVFRIAFLKIRWRKRKFLKLLFEAFRHIYAWLSMTNFTVNTFVI